MSWGYKIAPEAARQLRDSGPSAASEIKEFLEKRINGAVDPRAFGKALRSEFKGLWRYRVRDWRILCRLEDGVCVVVVVKVVHHSTVYD